MRCRSAARAGRALVALAVVIMLLAVVAGIAAARTTDYAATIKDGRAAAQALLAQSGAASLSLALVSGERVVWQETFGYADKATSTAPQADTMYGIASVSKMFATVAAMKLVDQGKLELDAPLIRFLPSFTMLSPAYQQITVHMLLNHSSGFPGSTYGGCSTAEYDPTYLPRVLNTLASSYLKATPGFMNVYTNDGFTVIESLVAAVSGKPYAQFVKDEVFTPLGMEHSAYPLQPFAAGSYAKSYVGDDARPQRVQNSLGSAGAYSTPTDLDKLGTMLMNGGVYGGTRILSAAAVAEMGTNQTLRSFNPKPDGALAFGLGWDSVTDPALHAAGALGWCKNGESYLYCASFIVAPRAKLAITVLAVAPFGTANCDDLARRVLLHALRDQGSIRRLPRPVPATAPPVKRATEEQLAAMTGIWANDNQVARLAPSAADPQALVFSKLAGGEWQDTGLFRLCTDDRFHPEGSAAGFAPLRAGGRQYLMMTSPGSFLYYESTLPFAQKLAAGDALRAAWQRRTGHAWLAANLPPLSNTYDLSGGPYLGIDAIPGLPGYVAVTTCEYGVQAVDVSGSDTLGAMAVAIPVFFSHELEDAVVVQHGSEEWIRWGDTLYRPADAVPTLDAGQNTVTFDAEGHTEWRSVAAAATVHIGGGTAWYVYDGDFTVLSSGTSLPADVKTPAGSSLALFGPAGSSITLTAAAN